MREGTVSANGIKLGYGSVGELFAGSRFEFDESSARERAVADMMDAQVRPAAGFPVSWAQLSGGRATAAQRERSE